MQKSSRRLDFCHSREAAVGPIFTFQQFWEIGHLQQAASCFLFLPAFGLLACASKPFSAAGFQYKCFAFVLEARHGANWAALLPNSQACLQACRFAKGNEELAAAGCLQPAAASDEWMLARKPKACCNRSSDAARSAASLLLLRNIKRSLRSKLRSYCVAIAEGAKHPRGGCEAASLQERNDRTSAASEGMERTNTEAASLPPYTIRIKKDGERSEPAFCNFFAKSYMEGPRYEAPTCFDKSFLKDFT